MKKKEIYLIVTPFFPTTECFRGPFVYDQTIAIRRNSSYDVIVFHPTVNKDNRRSYIYNGERVYLFRTKQTPSNLFMGLFDRYNCNRFKQALKDNNIDIQNIKYVHCHTMPFGCYGLSLKRINPEIKVFVQHHSRDPYSILYGRLANWRPNLLYRVKHSIKIAQEIDLHISVSKIIEDNLLNFPKCSNKEDYLLYLDRIRPLAKFERPKIKKSIVLYNGVDTDIFYPIRKRSKIEEKQIFKIGCIANFQKLKDQISLIKAVEIILNDCPDINISLSFIGSGPELRMCKDYVYKHSLSQKIIFDKEIDHSRLNEYYNSLDLFVLPSVYEGFGCVYTEAYASGVPFMLCEDQGATEYIKDSEMNYWVLKKKSPEDIAKKIETYIKTCPKQTLIHEYDINILIRDFLHKISSNEVIQM